jgi:hypothetical protein
MMFQGGPGIQGRPGTFWFLSRCFETRVTGAQRHVLRYQAARFSRSGADITRSGYYGLIYII